MTQLFRRRSIPVSIDDSINQALRSSDPYRQLRSLVESLFAKGQSTDTVLTLFETTRRQLREAGRQSDEDVLMDVMDCLVGWCGPDARLSPDPAPNDQGQANPTTEPPSR